MVLHTLYPAAGKRCGALIPLVTKKLRRKSKLLTYCLTQQETDKKYEQGNEFLKVCRSEH